MNHNLKNVEEYIASFPDDIQSLLKQLRTAIMQAVPEAEEGIGYGMPGYRLYGKPLVYFAAHTEHIGFYALPSGHAEFSRELTGYKQGKGSVQFPYNKPIPWDLISKMVAFRAHENSLNK